MDMIVHCKKHKYDIYIGRGKCPKTGELSEWGNPFKIGIDGNREEVINKYEEYLKKQLKESLGLKDKLKQLKGKILGCWCRPLSCHGDILLKYINLATEEAL